MTFQDVSAILSIGLQSGPIGLLLLGLAEKTIPLIPSYAVFVMIGVATSVYNLDPVTMTVALAFGSMAGSLCWYALGYTIGRQRIDVFVARYGRLIGLTKARYDYVASAYQRNVLLTTVIGQTIPAVRVYMAVPAGMLGLPLKRFSVAVLLGSFLWSTPLLLLGYFVGGRNADPTAAALWVIAALVGAECLILLTWHLIKRGRRPA
jgi:membrane protein DedA with SNARE-associated domain